MSDGLELRYSDEKGRGVFSTVPIPNRAFIVEYSGTLISKREAEERETKYNSDPKKYGSYMYYFQFEGTKYCIDATEEDGSYGRLINHAVNGNVESKVVKIDEKPVIIFLAKKDISAGVELCYDYGERSKSIVNANPWLSK